MKMVFCGAISVENCVLCRDLSRKWISRGQFLFVFAPKTHAEMIKIAGKRVIFRFERAFAITARHTRKPIYSTWVAVQMTDAKQRAAFERHVLECVAGCRYCVVLFDFTTEDICARLYGWARGFVRRSLRSPITRVHISGQQRKICLSGHAS